VAVNCTALPESLLESELFGHVRGAFTGATSARRGLFLEADGGTLFLDEIGDMPPNLQARLLRVLEDGLVRPVGSDAARKADVRLVAATHQPLEDRVHERRFRQDLFYRLNVVPIVVPPLRDRPGDVALLAAHFAGARRFAPDALAALATRSWPGNVRELENVVRRLLVLSSADPIAHGDVAAHVPPPASADPVAAAMTGEPRPLREVEDAYIRWAVERCGGNKTRAADLLGIDVSTIHRRGRK
jgi:two-component system response regulator HydG